MDKLKSVMVYFVQKFPQQLGRIKLIKSIYLLDCEWYKLHSETYSGLEYVRDNNGPFDTTFYTAKDELCEEGILCELSYTHFGRTGYKFQIMPSSSISLDLDPLAMYICDSIVEKLKNKNLQGFLDVAYATAPMLLAQENEKLKGKKCLGEELHMDELVKPPKPLFPMSRVKSAAKKLDLSSRGADQEYAEVVNEEVEQLRIYRERAAESWKLIQ